ncbi:uncharacterized protein LOC113305661 [Papaver somniferum]|uniref:uncharacterized protein LOC113305661 n=1 Tax=Papaver somniferum TaxID=3469 RepID=UPI000E6FC1E5|nr:uncharacterized protein LOC113305661 [Papaver somniferum]
MVWVRFPGLGLEFWNEKILFTICKEFGTPIKIDNATAKCEVGYYANVLVEVDFAKHIPHKVWIGTKYGGFFQDVLIPNCHKFCSSCKIVGHSNAECRVEKYKGVNEQQETSRTQTKTMEDKSNTKEKFNPVPFYICDFTPKGDSVVDSTQHNVSSSISSGEVLLQQSKFSPLDIE